MERYEAEVLRARLAGVERRLRLATIGWVVSLAVLLLIVVAVQRVGSQPAALEARSLDLVDASGQARISLSASRANGAPQVDFLDAHRVSRITLGLASAGTPFAEFLDPAGRIRLALGMSVGGEPIVTLADAQGHGRLTLEMSADGNTHMRMFDANGIRLFSAP